EYPLTLSIDGTEVVTLMTMGSRPEELALGYIRNQRLISDLSQIKSVHVDWRRESVQIQTHAQTSQDWHSRLNRRIVTSGCAQGTIFASSLEEFESLQLPKRSITQQEIYALVEAVKHRNDVYRQSGGVHGCALCDGDEILIHVEDVGRHNAADAIAGAMWLEEISGAGKSFYTTGRLTSEMVIKCAFMGIPVLLSRSSVTYMGYQMARKHGLTIVSRVRGKHYLLCDYSDKDTPTEGASPDPS
ncbi:MAG: formate dehydrogenase accessory sulfurtransferase FdhD, partial [Granulosicoccaceae bacterium]